MEFNTVKLEDLYKDWNLASALDNSCKPSGEAGDFSLYVSSVMAN